MYHEGFGGFFLEGLYKYGLALPSVSRYPLAIITIIDGELLLGQRKDLFVAFPTTAFWRMAIERLQIGLIPANAVQTRLPRIYLWRGIIAPVYA